MAVPEVIPIVYKSDYPAGIGYRTSTIGRYEGGQFFARVIAAMRQGRWRWYSVLHLFDPDGGHVRSDIWFAGTTPGGEPEAVRRAEEHLAPLLDALPGREYGDIAIRLFRVEFDGGIFGLIDVSDPERVDRAELYPGGLGFHWPWDGEYDT